MSFFRGDDVEIASKEDGFEGSYYKAIITTPIRKRDYIVQYRTLMTEDMFGPLRAFVDADEIRPVPPEIPVTEYQIGDKVDAYHNDGWWSGKIVRRIGDDKYSVYFKQSDEEIVYEFDELRVHQDWVKGKWVSKVKKKRKKY